MRKLILILLIIPLLSFSQKEFNNWHFGFGVTLDFSGGSPVRSSNTSINTNEGSATVSDCQGRLLFYTDGITVYNRDNNVMDNGTGLLAGSSGVLAIPPSQGALIVQRPKTSGIYYIFTSSSSRGIYYSVVNMNADGGRGSVIVKNIALSSQASEKLAVTYHSNQSDIWVVTHYADNNQYESFLVTPTGVSSSGVSSFDGASHDDGHGDLKISQDGSKIAAVIDFRGTVFLGNFDNATGKVTGTVSASGFQSPHGVEFSPNGKNMFINDEGKGIIQFDLRSGNNGLALGSPKSVTSPIEVYGSLQLGPDGKIYVANANKSYLGVIHNPDANVGSVVYSNRGVYVGTEASGYELTNVTLTSPPTFSGPNAVSFGNGCLGDITKFSLAIESDVVDVLWEFGDASSGLQNYSTVLSPDHKYESVGTYFGSVKINYVCGSEVRNFSVLISQPPNVSLDSIIVCSGVSTPIGISAESNVLYQWTPSTGLSNSNVANPSLLQSINEERKTLVYTLNARNSINGCSVTEVRPVKLTNPLVDAGPDVDVCSEDTVKIGSESRANYKYLWVPQLNLLNPVDAETDVILINDLDVPVVSSYTVNAILDGCTSFDEVKVNVKSLPKLVGPFDTTICSLDSIVLNEKGNVLDNYVWTTTEGLSNSFVFNPKFSISNRDTGIVEYQKYAEIKRDGCTNIDTVSISVFPQAGVDDYQYLCPGFGVALAPFNKGVTFAWSPNENIDDVTSKNPFVSPDVNTTYYLSVTDEFNCTYQDSVLIDVNPLVPVDLGNDTVICRDDTLLIGSIGHPLNAIYTWSPTVFLSKADSNYTFAYPDSTKEYIVLSQSDTCTGRDTIEIKVNQLPLVELLSDSSICFRDSIYLKAQGAENYKWSPNVDIQDFNDSALIYPSTTTKYYIEGTDLNGCVNYDSASIVVRPLPIIDLVPDTFVCFTDSIQVLAKGGGKYSWSSPEFVSNDTINNPFLIPEKSMDFIVTVTGTNRCSENDTVAVQVNSLPTIELMSDTTICDGTLAYLWAKGGEKYSWNSIAPLSAVDAVRPTSLTDMDANYKVIVTDSNNCVDSAVTSVVVNVSPEADFDYSFFASCPGFDVSFNDKSNNAESWNWDFGDGQFSSEPNPNHVYEFGNPVLTQLVVGNNEICFDTATVQFNWENLEDYITISAPNILTPNGDKFNECFEVEIDGDFEKCTTIEVFNRWGLKVYDSGEFSGCFRGVNEYNFQDLSTGTYFYVITVNDYIKNGFIEVIK